MRIKPKCGYWDCTNYPIGGCFCRAGKNGVEIDGHSISIMATYRGCDVLAVTDDGRKVAVNGEHLEVLGLNGTYDGDAT